MSAKVSVDPRVFPDDGFIRGALGDNYHFFESFFRRITEEYSDAAGSWKYYNDVKSWLFRMTRRKKTVFWLSLSDDTFRVTFYFNAKNEHVVIDHAGLPADMRKTFRESNEGKKFRNMTVAVRSNGDLDTVMTLVGLKLNCL